MDNPEAVNSANRRLSHLPPALKNHLRSGVALPSIARCVEELVQFLSFIFQLVRVGEIHEHGQKLGGPGVPFLKILGMGS